MTYDDYSPENLAKSVALTQAALGGVKDLFDSIVVRGVSGLIVGSPVALALGKPVVIVRKPGVSSHAHTLVSNAWHVGGRYVIVDDFVSMGNTMRAIQDAIDEKLRDADMPAASFAGLYQYAFGSWYESMSPETLAP